MVTPHVHIWPFTVHTKPCVRLCIIWLSPHKHQALWGYPHWGNWVPEEVNGLLQGEELLTNRDGLLAPNLRRFLLNCIGVHDKLVFETEAEIGQNPDKLFSSLWLQTGPYSQNVQIWGLRVDDCKIKTYSKREWLRLKMLTLFAENKYLKCWQL